MEMVYHILFLCPQHATLPLLKYFTLVASHMTINGLLEHWECGTGPFGTTSRYNALVLIQD